MGKILLIIFGLFLDAIGVMLIFDARIIANRMFGQKKLNKRSFNLKLLGFVFSIIGAVIIYFSIK